MKKIGIIGLGHMGLPMALNLIKHGFSVVGSDLQASPLAELNKAGGEIARDLTAFANCEAVITMLQTGAQVKTVCLEGLFQQLAPKTLFIDCSTIDVETSRAVTEAAYAHQLEAIDAPVSGGVKGAEAATLTFMVGGTEAAFARATPFLQAMGKNIIYAGHAGAGQAAKMCNNMILGISMIAVSEAFILAEKLGLTPQKLYEVVNAASGQCWVMSKYVPVPDVLPNVPANQDYKAGFASAMMLKDLHLSQEAAKKVGVRTPLGEKAATLYAEMQEKSEGELDFSAIIQFLRSIAS